MVDLNSLDERVGMLRENMEVYVDQYGSRKGLKLKSEEGVLRHVRDRGVASIRLWFIDVLGYLKSFSITPQELDGAFKEGMGFDGSSIKGYKRIQESDMVAKPIAETAQIIPFKIGGSSAMRMFARTHNPDGSVYNDDPRQVLISSLDLLTKRGYSHMNIGPEAEYFYFLDSSRPETLDDCGYFDLVPADIGDSLREATIFADQSMGIPVEYSHHEVGASQHEIDLKYCDALNMADRLMTHKWLVKEIARRSGVHATFMPKPIAGINGSGMHTHLSIFNGEKNAFFCEEDDTHLSDFGRRFLAGVLEHAPEITLITNQWYNSFKRLVPGYEAPLYIGWARRNRSALVRLPEYKPGKEEATRLEFRWPDPGCNPYLAFAAILRAGLRGVDKPYELDPMLEVDFYGLSDIEREEKGVGSLPHDLYDAIKKAEKGTILKEMMGKDMFEKLLVTKYAEYDKYRNEITPLELKEGLNL